MQMAIPLLSPFPSTVMLFFLKKCFNCLKLAHSCHYAKCQLKGHTIFQDVCNDSTGHGGRYRGVTGTTENCQGFLSDAALYM